MSGTTEFRTFSLDYVCNMTGAPSPDWLTRRIKAGEVSAVLAGREWRMTRTDMCRLVDYMRSVAEQEVAGAAAAHTDETTDSPESHNSAGLSKRSAARLARDRAA